MTYMQYKKIHGQKDNTQVVFNTFEPDHIKESLKNKVQDVVKKKMDKNKTLREHIEQQYHHRQNQSSKSLLEQWLDDYWIMNIRDEGNVQQSEEKIYNLIQMLLELGDDQLRFMQSKNIISPLTGMPLNRYETVRFNKHFKQSHIVLHQE